jgi:hypothetical protein
MENMRQAGMVPGLGLLLGHRQIKTELLFILALRSFVSSPELAGYRFSAMDAWGAGWPQAQ